MSAKLIKILFRSFGMLVAAAFLWTGAANSGSLFLNNLYAIPDGDAAAGARDNPAEPQLERLVADLNGGGNYERQRAAISLGNLNDSRAIEPLSAALDDEDDFVRNFAVRALGNLKDPRAVDSLIRALDDGNLLVRRSAADALGRIGDPRAVDPLIRKISDGDDIMRRAAVEALGKIGDPRAVAPIIELFREEDIFIWNGAAIALADFGRPALPQIVDALYDWTIGPRILGLLKNLQWQPATDEERVWFQVAARNRPDLLADWEAAERILVEAARQGNGIRAQSAVYALLGIGKQDSVGALIDFLAGNGSPAKAKAFLNSGNEDLAKAGNDWFSRNQVDAASVPEVPVVGWGKME